MSNLAGRQIDEQVRATSFHRNVPSTALVSWSLQIRILTAASGWSSSTLKGQRLTGIGVLDFFLSL
jgi:hypothetical protein